MPKNVAIALRENLKPCCIIACKRGLAVTNQIFKGMVIGGLALLAGCGGDLRDEIVDIPPGLLKEPYAFTRPGEPQAKYVIAHVSVQKDGVVTTINLRQSYESGLTFTRMALRCETGENRVMASADSYEGTKVDNPDPRWSKLVRGSSRYLVAQKACAVLARGLGA